MQYWLAGELLFLSIVFKYLQTDLEAVILQGGTTISSGAFMNCPALQAIYIPDSIADISDDEIVEEGKVIDIFKKPQTEIAKRFIQQEADKNIEETELVVEEMLEQYPNGKIVRLLFHGEQAKLPIISHIVQEYQVEVSIIQGNIQQTKQGAVGSLYIQLLGEEQNILDEYDSFDWKTYNLEKLYGFSRVELDNPHKRQELAMEYERQRKNIRAFLDVVTKEAQVEMILTNMRMPKCYKVNNR